MSGFTIPNNDSMAKLRASTTNVMPIPEMYKVATRSNQAWGVDGYEVPRKYQGVKNDKKLDMKKVNDELKKISEDAKKRRLDNVKTPAPNAYTISKPWVDDSAANKRKPINVGERVTFIEEIVKQNKDPKKAIPAPGAYNLTKSLEEQAKIAKDKKLKPAAKDVVRQNFLCEVEYLSATLPGPGQYNPRDEIPKIRPTALKPEDWRKKHAPKKREKLEKVPETNPYPVDFGTFGKLALEVKEKRPSALKAKMLGNDKRWPDEKKQKELAKTVPGPGQYNMIAQWASIPEKGKKADKKSPDWMKNITKGPTRSIYY